MKCDGCPLDEECDDQECSNDGSCHLTLADLPIIKAMLAGEWKCGTCVKNFDCPNPSVDIPCKIWQPREEAR